MNSHRFDIEHPCATATAEVKEKIMKKLVLIFAVFAACAGLGFSAPKMKKYTPDENNVKLLGRTVCKNNIAVMAHSGTGVEFNVCAKKLTVTVVTDSWFRQSRIQAFFNGERVLDEMLKTNKKEFVIFDSDVNKEGVVQIIKVTECTCANAGIEKISIDKDGTISPTETKSLKIEFLGDSATAGFGVDEPDPHKDFTVETEDISKTYAYKTAAALDAEFSIICASGWGVVYGGESEKRKEQLIPDVYDKIGIFKDVSVGGLKPGETKWDFSLFEPDVIVILLGANDSFYAKEDPVRRNEFKNGYVEFIKLIREKNPDSHILCCIGLAPDTLYPEVEAAVSEYKLKTYDNNVSYFRIKLHDGKKEGYGAGYHPSEKAYENAAHQLVPQILNILVGE